MSDDHHQEQDDEGGKIEENFEEQILGLIQSHAQLIQGLINTQTSQASINENALESIKGLDARIKMLEESM